MQSRAAESQSFPVEAPNPSFFLLRPAMLLPLSTPRELLLFGGVYRAIMKVVAMSPGPPEAGAAAPIWRKAGACTDLAGTGA